MFAGKKKITSIELKECDSNLVTQCGAPLLPGLNLSDGCLGSDWCLGGGEGLFNPPAAGVLWVGTASHKTLLLWDLFFLLLLSSLNNQSRNESLYWYFALFVLTITQRKKNTESLHWQINFFPSTLSSKMKWISCASTKLKSQMSHYYPFLRSKLNYFMVLLYIFNSLNEQAYLHKGNYYFHIINHSKAKWDFVVFHCLRNLPVGMLHPAYQLCRQ